jgi:hypothetical protein
MAALVAVPVAMVVTLPVCLFVFSRSASGGAAGLAGSTFAGPALGALAVLLFFLVREMFRRPKLRRDLLRSSQWATRRLAAPGKSRR